MNVTATMEMVPIHEAPEVAKAAAALGEARARYDAAVKRVRDAEAVNADAHPVHRVEAQAVLPQAREEMLDAGRSVAFAERAEKAARDSERNKRRAALEPELKKALISLREALIAASAANEKVKLAQYRLYEETNEPFDAVMWLELTSGSDSRLGRWVERLKREYGL
jgi:hypothetical protein